MNDAITDEFRIEEKSSQKVWFSIEEDDTGVMVGVEIHHEYHSEKIEDALVAVKPEEVVHATLRSLTDGDSFDWVVEDINRSGGPEVLTA